MNMKSVPVIYLIFNRPEATRRSHQILREIRPEKLLVVADGPRAHVADDRERCLLTRQIATDIDWPCELQTCFSDVNLGLKQRVASGLSWAFEQVEEAIVVEDDCLPDPSFFRFAAEMLEKYRQDERIMCISANNFQQGRRRAPYSYYFSLFPHCWGWATWRRSWRHFDLGMSRWPELRDGGWLRDMIQDKAGLSYWHQTFEGCHRGMVNSWATAWTFSCWAQNGLTLLPEVNLVRNIGFGKDGTNTTSSDNHLSAITSSSLQFPLRPPPYVLRDTQADHATQLLVYNPAPPPPLAQRILRKLRRTFSSSPSR